MSTELTADTLTQATKALTGKGPIQMLNLLRYFQDAHYCVIRAMTDRIPG